MKIFTKFELRLSARRGKDAEIFCSGKPHLPLNSDELRGKRNHGDSGTKLFGAIFQPIQET